MGVARIYQRVSTDDQEMTMPSRVKTMSELPSIMLAPGRGTSIRNVA